MTTLEFEGKGKLVLYFLGVVYRVLYSSLRVLFDF